VEIPKPTGGTRELGVPCVIDRLIGQALLQVLQPLIDPTCWRRPKTGSSSFSVTGAREPHDRRLWVGERKHTMDVIPGLSPLLEAAGKHISSWDDSGSRLVVDAGSVVQSAVCGTCQ
jgi:hypothetical protein